MPLAVGAVDLLSKGLLASEVITAKRFVKLDAAGSIDACDTAGEAACGVATESADADDVTNGKFVNVQKMGIAVVEAAVAIAAQAPVMTSNDGSATVVTGGGKPLGIALTAATADGDWMAVLLTPNVALGRADYIAILNQDISAAYVEAEVQAISTKVDAILTALVACGLMDAS
jgi:hypothetical protein